MNCNCRIKSEYLIVLAVLALLITGLGSADIIEVDADIITTSHFDHGASFHNGTNLHMPEANVSIVYTHDSDTDLLQISCDFAIFTNTTQNTTLAFVFPREWEFLDSLYEYIDITKNFTISRNSSSINYTIYSWDQLGWNISEGGSLIHEDYWLTYANYAVFDLELISNSTEIISVEIYASNFLISNSLMLSYIVGSARTFDSDTLQRIHVRIIENAPIISITTYPSYFRTISSGNGITDVHWKFNVSEFDYDSVIINLYVNEYHQWRPITNATTSTTTSTISSNFDPMIIATVGVTGVIAIGFVLVLVKFRRR